MNSTFKLMLHCSNSEVIMPRNGKTESPAFQAGDSSFVSLLSGWVQQGVENFFATQRILVDLAMSQKSNVVNLVRGRFADPEFCPMAIAGELAAEAVNNFIEGQKLLLNLAQREQEIVTEGVKERVSGSPTALAVAELTQRCFGTIVAMQQEFLKTAGKQTHAWLNAVKAGKPFEGGNLVEMARDAMDSFVHTQKKFLDAIAEETNKATSGKERPKKMKKTELAAMAKEATDAFIEAQKKLIDVAGQQVNAGMRAAGRVVNAVAPFPFLPIPDFTREGVKSFVTAEKALIDTVMNRPETRHPGKTTTHRARRRPVRTIKMESTHATA
ncbi:MAG TPA: hypothetical protein VFB04_01085 [Terriglobales bacterium]|nr:hypothetical protein [Terriglobales bacterium]